MTSHQTSTAAPETSPEAPTRPATIRDRTLWIAVSMMGAVAVAVRLTLWQVWSYQYAFDSEGYVSRASRPHGLLDATASSGLYTFQPPIYPLLVTLYHSLGAGSIAGYRAAGIAVGLALLVATVALTKRLFSNRAALIAGAISVASVNLINGDLNLHPETLASLLLVVCVLCMVGWLDDKRWQWAVGVGFAAGVAALTRGELVALIPLSAAVVIVTRRAAIARGALMARAKALVPAAVIVATAVAVMAPWWAVTAHITGTPVLSTTGGTTHVTFGACPDTFYRDEFAYSSWNCLFPRSDYFSDEELANAGVTSQRTEPLDPAGTSFIGDHLRDYPAVMTGRLGRTLGLYLPQDQARRSQIVGEAPSGVGMWVWVEWVLLCLLAVPGAAALWHRSRARLLLLGWYVAPTLAAIALGVGFTRYRTVFLPLIVVLAAAGLATVTSQRRVSRNVGIGLVALGSLFVAGRVAEAADFDPIHPTEAPTPLADEFGTGGDPGAVIGPIEGADSAVVSSFQDAPLRRVSLGTDVPARILDVDEGCVDRFAVFHRQSAADGGIVVGYSDESNYTLIRPNGPYLGWEVARVRGGSEQIVAASGSPNRSGWVTVQAEGNRVVLYQQGTPLIWFDTDAPVTNVGSAGASDAFTGATSGGCAASG